MLCIYYYTETFILFRKKENTKEEKEKRERIKYSVSV